MINIPISVRRVAVMIGILMLVFIVLEFNRRLEELNMLNQQNEFMHAQATQAIQTQDALQTQVAYAGSNAAVEEWARTDGRVLAKGVARSECLVLAEDVARSGPMVRAPWF